MLIIKNYHDTKIEYNTAVIRLKIIKDKIESIHSKYFSITSKIKEVVSNSTINNDKIINYLIELDKIDKKTGKSIKQEYDDQYLEVKKLRKLINKIQYNLKRLKGIEYKIYYAIINNSTENISKILESLAEEECLDISTLWRKYASLKKYL